MMTTTTPFPAGAPTANHPARSTGENSQSRNAGIPHPTREFEPRHRSRSIQTNLRRLAMSWRALSLVIVALATPAHADFTTVNGHPIYYETHGDLTSGRTPVLLLHGGMNTIDMNFTDFIPRLAAERPVIAVEQQGHGHTADRDAPVTLASMRHDTLAVLDDLDVEKAHVVGFSMGAMLGLELAVNRPERVASLSALSASADAEGMIPEIVRMNQDPNFQPSPELAKRLPTQEDFEAMMAGFADNPSGAENFQVMMGKLGRLITSDWGWSDSQLSGIESPVLVAIGDRDFILPEHAVDLSQTIPDAHLAILPDTTHMTIIKRTDLILPMIEDLIASAERGLSVSD